MRIDEDKIFGAYVNSLANKPITEGIKGSTVGNEKVSPKVFEYAKKEIYGQMDNFLEEASDERHGSFEGIVWDAMVSVIEKHINEIKSMVVDNAQSAHDSDLGM